MHIYVHILIQETWVISNVSRYTLHLEGMGSQDRGADWKGAKKSANRSM